jgi:hypothetical protein
MILMLVLFLLFQIWFSPPKTQEGQMEVMPISDDHEPTLRDANVLKCQQNHKSSVSVDES